MPDTAEDPFVAAFPKALCANVRSVLAAIPAAKYTPREDHIGPIVVAGERLEIPFRMYSAPAGANALSGLSETQMTVLGCIYTRHHDGFIRQRFLEAILPSPLPWVAPFVVQLVGEYVVEIIVVLATRIDLLQRPHFAAFVRDNPEFLALTRQRVCSYWDCYYRGRYPKREQYPGFEVLAVLEALAPRGSNPSR